MVDGLKPYPEYKPTRLKWTGAIPSHWYVKRPKTFLVEIEDRSTTGTETLLSMRMRAGLVPFSRVSAKIIPPEQLIGYKRTQPGDIVLNRMQASNGMFARTIESGLVSPDYAVLRPTAEVDIRYLTYLFKTPAMRARFRGESKGLGTGTAGFLRLYSDRLFAMPVVFPPIEEQAVIADFLDAQAEQVAKYVRTKRRQLNLFNEQKQAIVHRVLTAGLNPSDARKRSGISWLREVPLHWAVVPLQRRYSVELGKMLDAKRITGKYLVPYLRNTDVQWDRINSADLPMMDIDPQEYDRYTVRPGDLLVCEGGDVGRCAFWEGALPLCGYQKALHRLRPIDGTLDNPRYLFYLMYSASKQGVFRADGSENTIAHLTREKLCRYRFAFPPRSEQDATAACSQRHCGA